MKFPLQKKNSIQWAWLVVVGSLAVFLFIWESRNLKIETDILKSMPQNDPVLADARLVIGYLPVQDRVFIDLEQTTADREKLVKAAAWMTERLARSGLFAQVGPGVDAENFSELVDYLTDNLPVLYSEEDLKRTVEPLLAPEKIREILAQNREALSQLECVGCGGRMARDPLGLSGLLLRQLPLLSPAGRVKFCQGQILSEDERHALILAKISGSPMNTATAAKIQNLLEECRQALVRQPWDGQKYGLTSVGAYRVALDNETIAKKDMRLAVGLTTLGIVCLLVLIFPRPFIGLLALLPSAVGSLAALLVCSFFFETMSVIALGFGAAIMAFTVDLGLTYLLFLDQQRTTYGEQVAREVRPAELLAVLTTQGAFLLLLASDFKIMVQIGFFSALGVTFAFLIVHLVFPRMFPLLPPAKRATHPLFWNAVQAMATPARWKVVGAILFAGVMIFFAKPVFNVDLNAMNSMSEETLAANRTMQRVWGNFSDRRYALLRASSMAELQKKNDDLMQWAEKARQAEILSSVFLPGKLFPSEEMAKRNFAAWRVFWSKPRATALKENLSAAAREFGFASDAFAPFFQMLEQREPVRSSIPSKALGMLGIQRTPEGLTQLIPLAPGKNYDAEGIFRQLSQGGVAKFFDADLFNKRLGEFLKNLFLKMAIIIGIGLLLVVFLYFLDWHLSLAAVAPVVFALVATLGTLKLIGRPVDIPGIMLWVVIMGMGIDYGIYYICMYQRHPDSRSQAMKTIHLAIFLSACTTLIGFGVLALAAHALLRSIGLVSLLGIFYAFLGSFFILPVAMEKIFAPAAYPTGDLLVGSRDHRRRTLLRYRHLPAYPRVFARLKMRMDPMFGELNRYVRHPRRILDIGCGYGVPAAWLLEIYPQAQVFGIDPDEERGWIASRVIGARGAVVIGKAPDLPEVEGEVDYALMLDVLHFLDDNDVRLIFRRLYDRLTRGGTLVIRTTVPAGGLVPWKRWMENVRLKVRHTPVRFRAERDIVDFMRKAGFAVDVFASDDSGVEEKWFVGRKSA